MKSKLKYSEGISRTQHLSEPPCALQNDPKKDRRKNCFIIANNQGGLQEPTGAAQIHHHNPFGAFIKY
jgi:hypothetical protein